MVACGNYEEINKTGFNIKDILDTFLAVNNDKKDEKIDKQAKKQKAVTFKQAKLKDGNALEDEADKEKKEEVKLTADETEHPAVTF